MPRISLWFFFAGAIYAVIGMAWGMHMGASGDHSQYPAHAHLNLLGWVTMAIYGTFFALAADKALQRLGWVIFGLSNLGVVALIPMLALITRHGELPAYLMVIVIGEVMTVLAMVTFAYAVLDLLRRRN